MSPDRIRQIPAGNPDEPKSRVRGTTPRPAGASEAPDEGEHGALEQDDVAVAMIALQHLVSALRRSSHVADKAMGVSGAQLFVLHQLSDAGACLSIAELAERTSTDQSSVSELVSRLVGRGLAARQSSRIDARRTEVAITDAGRDIVRAMPAPLHHRVTNGIASLPPDRRRELVAALKELVAAVGERSTRPGPSPE